MADGVDILGTIEYSSLLSHLKNQVTYLESHVGILDSHMVDFFTQNLWETLLSSEMRDNLLCLSSNELSSLPSSTSELLTKRRNQLMEFVTSAKEHQLSSWDWVRDGDIFTRDKKCKPAFVDYCMKPKKSYEVELMSDVVNCLANKYNTRKVLDLGSGKGYLSQYLALQYGLHVMGIDSSPGNTENAKKRNAKVQRVWPSLQSKAESLQGTGGHGPECRVSLADTKVKSKVANAGDTSDTTSSVHHSSEGGGERTVVSHSEHSALEEAASNVQSVCVEEEPKHRQEEGMSYPFECSDHKKDSNVEPTLESGVHCLNFDSNNKESKERNHSGSASSLCDKYCASCSSLLLENQDTGLSYCNNCQTDSKQQFCKGTVETKNRDFMCRCTTSHLSPGCEADKPTLGSCKTDDGLSRQDMKSFVPITGYVNSCSITSGELASMLCGPHEPGSDRQQDNDCSFFIVGLHTCGDLGPTALRMFVTEPKIKLLCVVGCCYHLLTQQSGSEAQSSAESGFPLSEFLKERQFKLSRNATMVAQQAANKIASENKMPPRSVLYRAMLQVILQEKYGLDGKGYHVGRIGAKCKSFSGYVHKAVNKLGLDIKQLTEEEITSYLERFEDRERLIHAFHQVRAILAPCIESLFLLDRLCYLYEQEVGSACVVRLFDPVRSPRCYAIVAVKNEISTASASALS